MVGDGARRPAYYDNRRGLIKTLRHKSRRMRGGHNERLNNSERIALPRIGRGPQSRRGRD